MTWGFSLIFVPRSFWDIFLAFGGRGSFVPRSFWDIFLAIRACMRALPKARPVFCTLNVSVSSASLRAPAPAEVPIGPWPPTDLFAVANWRACDTAAPLRCAEVKLCFLSPCVGFLKGLVERPTFTVSQSWPALPPKLDIVACAVLRWCGSAALLCVRVGGAAGAIAV